MNSVTGMVIERKMFKSYSPLGLKLLSMLNCSLRKDKERENVYQRF